MIDINSLSDLEQFIIEKADMIIKRGKKINATQIGLDRRAGGELYIVDEGIAVHKSCRKYLDYYGGFEYIQEADIMIIGNYVIYTCEDSRVEECLEYYYRLDDDLLKPASE